MRQTFVKPLAFRVRADLFNSLAAMEKAGLPVAKAVALLSPSAAARVRFEKFRHLVTQGVDVATAGKKSTLFTPLEVSLLSAALHAGSPATTYRRLADSYTRQAQQIATIKSSLLLPSLVFIIALLVQPLPSLIAGTISGWGYLALVLRPLAALLALVYLVTRLKNWFAHAPATPTQTWIARQLTQVPVFGAMHVRRNNHDFFAALALLLEAGIPMFDALPKAAEVISNSVIREDFSRLKPRMLQGVTLAQAVEQLAFVGNAHVVGYIQTGEGSGTLPEMLLRFTNAESDAVSHFQKQVADWLPRIVYGLLVLWIAYGILTASPLMPQGL